jgi:hypothetical protein
MHRNQRIIFGNIGGHTQKKVPGPCDDPTYLHNTLILEIASNWIYVVRLMHRFNNKTIKTVDNLERDWITFMMENHVDVNKYGEDSSQFINDWLKKNIK